MRLGWLPWVGHQVPAARILLSAAEEIMHHLSMLCCICCRPGCCQLLLCSMACAAPLTNLLGLTLAVKRMCCGRQEHCHCCCQTKRPAVAAVAAPGAAAVVAALGAATEQPAAGGAAVGALELGVAAKCQARRPAQLGCLCLLHQARGRAHKLLGQAPAQRWEGLSHRCRHLQKVLVWGLARTQWLQALALALGLSLAP